MVGVRVCGDAAVCRSDADLRHSGDRGWRDASGRSRLSVARQVGLGGGKDEVARCFYPAHLVLALLDVSLGVVVHVEANEGHRNTDGLDRMDSLREPNNRDADDSDTLDEGGDRVGYRRRRGKDDERDDVLREVHCAVGNEVIRYRVRRRMAVRGMHDVGLVRGKEDGEIVVHPDGDHQEERHTR